MSRKPRLLLADLHASLPAMTRATWVFVATTVVGLALAILLYIEKSALEDELAAARASTAAAPPAEKTAAARSADIWSQPTRQPGAAPTATGPAPKLPDGQ